MNEDDIEVIDNAKKRDSSVDRIRLRVLTAAELFDAWRVVPRIMVTAYGWMCWEIVRWYMSLKPIYINDCPIDVVDLCLIDAPTTQHTALVTVVISAAAAVFGFYTNTGRSWSDTKFMKWDDTRMQKSYAEDSINDANSRTTRRREVRDQSRRRYDQRQATPEFQEPDDFWDGTKE